MEKLQVCSFRAYLLSSLRSLAGNTVLQPSPPDKPPTSVLPHPSFRSRNRKPPPSTTPNPGIGSFQKSPERSDRFERQIRSESLWRAAWPFGDGEEPRWTRSLTSDFGCNCDSPSILRMRRRRPTTMPGKGPSLLRRPEIILRMLRSRRVLLPAISVYRYFNGRPPTRDRPRPALSTMDGAPEAGHFCPYPDPPLHLSCVHARPAQNSPGLDIHHYPSTMRSGSLNCLCAWMMGQENALPQTGHQTSSSYSWLFLSLPFHCHCSRNCSQHAYFATCLEDLVDPRRPKPKLFGPKFLLSGPTR